MITPAQMYWLTRLDTMNDVCGIVALTLAIGFPLFSSLGFIVADANLQGDKFIAWVKRHLKCALFVVAICLIVISFVPTTREMAAILIVPRIANSEKVQQAGNKLYDLAVEWMDELKPNKKGTDK